MGLVPKLRKDWADPTGLGDVPPAEVEAANHQRPQATTEAA